MSTLVTITPDMIEKATLCGQCQMTAGDTSSILRIGLDEFIRCDELLKPYCEGILDAQLAVRRAMLQKATDGDSTACREFSKQFLVDPDA